MRSDRRSTLRETVAGTVGDSLARGFAVVALAVIAAIVMSYFVNSFR